MLKPAKEGATFRHSDFVIVSTFVIRASSFTWLEKRHGGDLAIAAAAYELCFPPTSPLLRAFLSSPYADSDEQFSVHQPSSAARESAGGASAPSHSP